MRRLAAPVASRRFGGVAAAATARRTLMYSEQNAELADLAKAKGYTSNLWIDLSTDTWAERVSKPRAGEEPAEVWGERQQAMYNSAQFASAGEAFPPEPERHASVRQRSRTARASRPSCRPASTPTPR